MERVFRIHFKKEEQELTKDIIANMPPIETRGKALSKKLEEDNKKNFWEDEDETE